jgi:hypothetical protein
MGHRVPLWENWWALMDRLGGFPKWVRLFDLEPCKTLSEIERFAGKSWTSVAYRKNRGSFTVWGYFETDIDNLLSESFPAHDAEPTPAWLIGMEEV